MGSYTKFDFGGILKRLREEKGLKRAEYARSTGIHVDTIKRIEDGRTTDPGINTVAKLFLFFGYRLTLTILFEDLLVEEEPEDYDTDIELEDDFGSYFD